VRPWDATFLGFRAFRIFGVTRTVIHPKTVRRFNNRVCEITRRVRGRNILSVIEALNSFLRGWRPYYEFSMGKKLIHELNRWIARRLKAFFWNQWKLPRTRVKRLKQRGIEHDDAMRLGNTRKGPWRILSLRMVIAISATWSAGTWPCRFPAGAEQFLSLLVNIRFWVFGNI